MDFGKENSIYFGERDRQTEAQQLLRFFELKIGVVLSFELLLCFTQCLELLLMLI